MARQRVPAEPKPFFWIALDREQEPRKDSPPGHDRFSGWSGRLELEIKVLSDYLYVGSGEIELFMLKGREQAYYAFARRNGQLIIPGTGIKGAVRSVVEAISNSCVRQTAREERTPGSHDACKDEKLLCPACRLFGTTGYRGRVHFSDAMPVDQIETTKIKIADLWPPRQFQGRKFYQTKPFQGLDMQPEKSHRFIEVVPRGSRFRTTLYFENTTAAEMGLLIRAIGLDRDQQDPTKFPIKLGGAKPRCLGAVRLKPVGVYLITPSSNLLAALSAGGEPKAGEPKAGEPKAMPSATLETLRTWLADTSLLDDKAWAEFREKARPQNEPCPREVY